MNPYFSLSLFSPFYTSTYFSGCSQLRSPIMKRDFLLLAVRQVIFFFIVVNSSTILLEIINEAQNIGVLILLIMLHIF